MQLNHHQMRGLLRLSTNKPPKNTSLIHLDVVLLTVLCGNNSSGFFDIDKQRLSYYIAFSTRFLPLQGAESCVLVQMAQVAKVQFDEVSNFRTAKKEIIFKHSSFFNVQNGVEKVFLLSCTSVMYGSPFPRQNKKMK